MKVYLGSKASPAAAGMYRVYDLLFKELPKHGIDIVDTIEEADVVHAHIAVDQDISPNKPLVVSSHGMWWTDIWGEDSNAWGVNQHLIEAYRQADVVTAPSQFVADAIKRNTLIPAQVVHHGIDVDEWTPGQPKGYVFWNKARVDAANDPTVVNRLAELAPDIQFITTFGTPTSNVKVIGTVAPEEIKTYLQGASVYLDTPVESGGPCFGVLEAMACGVPVLAWDEGGNAEIVEHLKTGYLAKPGNFSDLLAGLNICLVEGKKFGLTARNRVETDYRSFDTCRGYIEAYSQAIKKYSVKVSVIVPSYNLAKYLPMCLDSLLEQTFQDWEAVVVVDASPDNSYEVAQQYAQKDVRIKVINLTQNVHVSEARNIGVLNSKGQYILPLDADDRLTPHALEVMVQKLDSTRKIDIVSGTLMLYQDGYFDGDGPYQGWPNTAHYDQQIAGLNRLPYSSMYRRKVWENLGGYRRRIRTGVEDGDFWTRALSYGYRAEVIQHHTLKYTIRENSLRTANPYGVEAWLGWFPWSKNPLLTPFGALGEGPYRVSYDDPLVSVVIPVGPGHEHHIQGCIDSLIAQTVNRWEAIVINDTGQKWFDGDNPLNHYVMGMPFVKFIDSDEQHGVAYARNTGILSAKADKIIFLDVDDIAQPDMVNILLQAHERTGGWVYGDWIANDNGRMENKEADDWSVDGITNKMLAPITGLYEKQHLIDVMLFDEEIEGWEDWDLQLKLLEDGICGTRVKYPLICYNMHLGARREENFENKAKLIQSIRDRHQKIYGGFNNVGCSRCGGSKTLNVFQQQQKAVEQSVAQNAMVWLKYTGPETQFRTFKSKTLRGVQYQVSNLEPFAVFASDVDYFLSIRYYERMDSLPTTQPEVEGIGIPLTSQAPVGVDSVGKSLDTLNLKPEVIGILKNYFSDTRALRNASDSDLLQIRGIGDARIREIRKVLKYA